MMKKSLLFIALCVSLIVGDDSKFSYVSGRSGDILLRSKEYVDDSVVYLIKDTIQADTIEDQSFADLISHLLGGPVINEQVNRNFPSRSIFDKSSANTLFVVDSVDSEALSAFSGLKMLKNGHALKLEKTSYPQDNVASAATLSSGFSTSVHGITGSSWVSFLGQIHAYKSGALPLIQNLADSFSQTFEGKSLIYSSSSDYQMSSAFGVNQFVHYPSNNEITLRWNPNSRRMESTYQSNMNVTSLFSTASDIFSAVRTTPLAMPGPQDTITMDQDGNYVVNMISKNIRVVFSANDLIAFFAELQSVRNILAALEEGSSLRSLTVDNIPDVYTFTFASIKNLERKYGRSSEQYKAIIYLLDETISAAIKSFNTIYSNKVSTQIIFNGKSGDEALAADAQAKNEIFSLISRNVQRDIFYDNFPSIYLNERADPSEVCDILKFSTDYDVYCGHAQALGYYNLVYDSNNSTNVTTDDVGVYQICVWFPIILILAILATVIAFCCMDVGADSMIYRSTNLKTMRS